MSSQIARKVVNAFQSKPADTPDTNTAVKTINILSNRENEILELLSRGMLYKEIAAKLFISQETVRKHVYHIYEKMHVNNRVEAINKFYGR
jgi:DNA-binding NarL/FixJ family response regulator